MHGNGAAVLAEGGSTELTGLQGGGHAASWCAAEVLRNSLHSDVSPSTRSIDAVELQVDAFDQFNVRACSAGKSLFQSSSKPTSALRTSASVMPSICLRAARH
jgi:hypothetical protein